MNDFEERVRRSFALVSREVNVEEPSSPAPRRRRRPDVLPTVLLAAAAALVAILIPVTVIGVLNRSEPPLANPTTTSSPSEGTSPTSSPSATQAPTQTPSVPASGKPGALVYDMSGTAGAGFVSPSGNIWCAIFTKKSGLVDAVTVRCDVQQHDYAPPPRPKGCQTDFGFAIGLDPKAHFLCAGDTIGDYVSLNDRFGAPYVVWFDAEQNPTVRVNAARMAGLAYGNSIKVDQITCTSTKSGVDCTNTKTGAGFLIARSNYQLRP